VTIKTKAALWATLILATLSMAQAQSFTMLHAFTGADGANPQSPLIADAAGNFYGTTFADGASGYGTVFKMDTNNKVTVLYSFAGPPDAANPSGPLLMDRSGNLYGTTVWGGASNQGAVFKLTSSGHETVLYSFAGYPDDGSNPEGGVISDPDGNLYGTTDGGGDGAGCGGYIYGCGVVFELDTVGHETVLHTFNGDGDGAIPWAGLLRDAAGNLYGTTVEGGTSGLGTVFQLDTTGTLTLLHSFTGTDGSYPYGAVIRDAKGNFYGTAYEGGSSQVGTVFKLNKSGKLTVLHNFKGNTDGAYPPAALVRDTAGNLYGTTAQGGSSHDFGTVFKVDATGKESVIHSFTTPRQGMLPEAGLLLDKAGNLYGTTYYGGSHTTNGGIIFKLTP
jgi:uncharacterized repeat protein (TIGR03803 family)